MGATTVSLLTFFIPRQQQPVVLECAAVLGYPISLGQAVAHKDSCGISARGEWRQSEPSPNHTYSQQHSHFQGVLEHDFGPRVQSIRVGKGFADQTLDGHIGTGM